VLFTVGDVDSPEDYDDSRIDAVRPSTGERFTIYEGASFARYVPSGHLLLGREGYLFGAPFDIDSLKLLDEPVPVLENVRGSRSSGIVHASIAEGGTLAYIEGERTTRRYRMVWRMPDGTDEPLAAPVSGYLNPAISPDGTRIAVAIEGDRTYDIWIYEIVSGLRTKLTSEGDNGGAVWSRDGEWIAYHSARTGSTRMFVQSLAGLSPAREVYGIEGWKHFPQDFSPDGQSLLVESSDPDAARDILRVRLDGVPRPEAVVEGPANESSANYSPDGKWIVYTSDESGQLEIYVRPIEAGSGHAQISVDGGRSPRWATNGWVYYVWRDRILAAEIETTPRFSIVNRKVVTTGAIPDVDGTYYDVSDDGKRLLLVLRGDDVESRPHRVRIVAGWGARMAADLERP